MARYPPPRHSSRRSPPLPPAIRTLGLAAAVAAAGFATGLVSSWVVPPGGGGGATLSAASYAEQTSFWRDRHLFFAVSPGRSGTHFLASLLATAADPPLVAAHEPHPQMGGPVLRQVLYTPGGRAASLANRTETKVGAMARALAGTTPGVGYAETSHQFVVTWADAVLGALADAAAGVTVVVLRRPPADVAVSQARLGWFSPGHSGWGVWYYDPARVDAAEAVLPPPPGSAAAAAAADSGGGGRRPADATPRPAAATADWAVPPGSSRPPAAALVDYNLDVAARGRALAATIADRQAAGAWSRVRLVTVDVDSLGHLDGGRAALARLGVVPDEARLAALYASAPGGAGGAARNDRADKKARGGGGRAISEAAVRRALQAAAAARGLGGEGG
ncbi:hypothetical protein I4F81_000240 [Pyropia yezoensis]|uniref:Uncharacterized protein n=1 Tax=Pyropia yezoensis TaxID=2788 RepID=A0ACC3BI85_PYRYE|nr:hypothetical protein I4F81_000240 [Neopyropia yezoensis]